MTHCCISTRFQVAGPGADEDLPARLLQGLRGGEHFLPILPGGDRAELTAATGGVQPVRHEDAEQAGGLMASAELLSKGRCCLGRFFP